jgi:hypothetical protein
MNIVLEAQLGKDHRDEAIYAESLEYARYLAKELIDYYARFSNSPVARKTWSEGKIWLREENGTIHVLRHGIPLGWRVIEGGKTARPKKAT